MKLALKKDQYELAARAREQAREVARRHVIEAKRRMTMRGRSVAYTDGHYFQPIEGRTDRRGK